MAADSVSAAAPATPGTQDHFDIVAAYRRLLAEDPDLTMPVAAIEALVEALAHSSASTISETLSLLSTHISSLKSAIANPISLSAGTDLFQRYLITTMQRSTSSTADFRAIRNHLLSNGRLFVARAKASRDKIAGFGRHFVRDGKTVLTNGGSRVVGALLQRAAEAGDGSVRFRVVYVLGETNRGGSVSPSRLAQTKGTAAAAAAARRAGADAEGADIVDALRRRGVPVATIPEAAVAYALGKVDMVIVGAEGVVENGGIISRLGTYQIGMLAKAAGKPFYVVAESHKFVRLFPLSQYDLGIEQRVIEFKTEEGGEVGGKRRGLESSMESISEEDEGVEMEGEERRWEEKTPLVKNEDLKGYFEDEAEKAEEKDVKGLQDAVDFTPPNLISGIITESGVLTPSAVSEELIKIWF